MERQRRKTFFSTREKIKECLKDTQSTQDMFAEWRAEENSPQDANSQSESQLGSAKKKRKLGDSNSNQKNRQKLQAPEDGPIVINCSTAEVTFRTDGEYFLRTLTDRNLHLKKTRRNIQNNQVKYM